MLSTGQAAAFYYARKRNRAARPMSVSMAPRSASIAHQTLAADTTVSTVDNISDNGLGANTISLSGADASKFKVTGRSLQIKSGTVLSAASTLTVVVGVSNDVRGDASASFQVTVT